MDNKRLLALRKQLKREQLHVVWLEQHLPHSRSAQQLHSSESHSCVCLEGVVESAALPTTNAATKKSDAEAPLSL